MIPDAAEVVIDTRLAEFWTSSSEWGAVELMEDAGLMGVFASAVRAAYLEGYTAAITDLKQGRPGLTAEVDEYEQGGA